MSDKRNGNKRMQRMLQRRRREREVAEATPQTVVIIEPRERPTVRKRRDVDGVLARRRVRQAQREAILTQRRCRQCSAAVPDGVERCGSCGKLAGESKPCDYCREPIHVDATACPDCGQVLGHILHVPARQGRWYRLRPEYWLERFVHSVRRLAILDILEYASRLAIIVALVGWILGAGDRREESVLRSWQVLAAADQLGGQQAAISALENLNCTRERGWWEIFPCERVSLQGIELVDYSLADIDLSSAELRDADLSGAELRDADLSGAELRDANLSSAELRDANLSSAELQDADLSGAYLYNADLRGAHLWGADLRGAYLWDADLSGAYLYNVDLRGAHLWGADLRGADLSNADLRGAYSWGADLRGANLQWTDLSEVDFVSLYLGEVAYYDDETVFPAGFDPVGAGLKKIDE